MEQSYSWVMMLERKENLHSVEQEKLLLVTHQCVTPSTRHLRQTVNAADEDSDVGQEDEPTEKLDSAQARSTGFLVRLVCTLLANRLVLLAGVAVAENVDEDKDAADGHGDDLERDTGDNELVAAVNERLVGCAARGSHASSAGLEHNGAKVAADEDPGIETGLDERMLGTAVEHKVL